MKCQRCQHENPPNARFCEECAAPLSRQCTNCGTPVRATAKFCPGCAHPVEAALIPSHSFGAPDSYTPKHLAERILTSRSTLEGERKQVTVLFADLKGSMELLADRDPEDARKLLDPVLERMIEAVHRYEGTVNQVMGDGIMALFGAPIALEDHAVRACYAALAIQAAIRAYAEELTRSNGITVHIRVGINSGEVVVRAISNDLHMDYTAVGQTTHLAARMEQLAAQGSTLLTENTLQLVEGFVTVKPRGPVPVKGLTDPVLIYELTGAGAARNRLQAAALRGLTQFVGRTDELGQLNKRLEQAGAGHGQIAALVGEPGVGKSRLVWEFTRSHRTHDWLVLDSGSVSSGRASAYRPVIDLLKGYFQVTERDDARRMREKVTGKLLALDEKLRPLLMPMLVLLDVPFEDLDWAQLDPAQRRLRILDACKRLMLREAQVQPMVLVFEDLHWIDTETQAFLDGLVESLPTTRILMLVNFRPEYENRWTIKTYYTQLRIDSLSGESAEALLSSLLGNEPSLLPLKRLLIERTEGNPLFVEESVRTLVETGALKGERGSYRLVDSAARIEVPATVQVILASRIDRLSPDEKRILQAAAVIGKDVPYLLLQAIAELSEEQLRQGLVTLQANEFLYEASLFPDLEYTFKHALTHEVAYGSVLQERRCNLHSRIVGTIERLYAERVTEQVERLAYHAVRGGLEEKAVQYLREAGVKAVQRSAYREAIEFFEQALTLVEALPDSARINREALSIRMALGPALMAMRGLSAPEVEACYLRALELCDRLQDRSQRFPALWGLWYANMGSGKVVRAFEVAQQAFGLAEAGDEPTFLLEGHHAMWSTLIGLGRSTEAAEHCQRGITLYDRQAVRSWWLYGTHDPGVCCRHILGVTSWLLGRPDAAVKWIEEALRLAGDLRHDFTTMIALYMAGLVHYHRGELETAAERADTVVAFRGTHGFTTWPERAAAISAAVLLEQGRIDEGLARAEDALRRAAVPGWPEVFSTAVLARAYGKAGKPAKGIKVLEALSDRNGVNFYKPEVQRIRGELLLTQEKDTEAQSCFRTAIDLACARQEKSLELRAAMSLARALSRSGQREQARVPLATACAGFCEGSETADLREARCLLEQLS